MKSTLAINTHSPEQTQEVGQAIGEQAEEGDIFLLTGPLGAGKTCLTQGIAWGLGVAGYARSPSYVLMSRYRGRLTLYHLDLYRVNDPMEAWDLGLEEQLFGDGVCVVEWADRAAALFPEASLWIALDYAPGQSHRIITLKNAPSRYRLMLEKLSAAFPVTEEVKS